MIKKTIAFAIALMITAAFIGGCLSKPEQVQNDEITLNWIMPGEGEKKDSKRVWAEFNEKLKSYKGMENVNVNIRVITTSDYNKSFNMLQSEKSNIDIVQTYLLDWGDCINKELFLPLDELIDNYAPNIRKELPEKIFEYGRYNGELYFVPNYQMMYSPDWGVYAETELLDNYGNEENMRDTFLNSQYWDENCWDAIEDYLKFLKDNGKLGLGYIKKGRPERKGYEPIGNDFLVDIYNSKVYFADEAPHIKFTNKKLSEFYKKGYLRKDILSIDEDSDERGGEGYSVFHEQLWPSISGKDVYELYGKKFKVFQTLKYHFLPKDAPAGGNAIMKDSKHPKEAARLLELMNTEEGKELYRLLVYGNEGEHYVLNDNGRISVPDSEEGNNVSVRYGLWKWIVGNTEYAFESETEEVGNAKFLLEENFNPSNIESKLKGFVVDNSKISVELMQISALSNEYTYLRKGVADDFEKDYEEYMQKLHEAGIDKVRSEYQRQVDEFLVNKK